MTKKQKRQLTWSVVIIAVVAAAALLLPRLWRPDFRKQLAKTLNANAEFLLLNLPPAEGRLPGSVFVREQMLLPVAFTQRDDAGISQGTTFELGWSQLTDASGQGTAAAGPLGGLFGATESAQLELKATNCRVLEMTLGNIRQRLLASADVQDLTARNRKMVVIVRAYEGVLETKVRRTSKLSAEAWNELKAKAKSAADPFMTAGKAKVEIKGETDDEVLLAWKEPVVFACEVQEATLFTTHLGTKPNEVKFEVLKAREVPAITTSGSASISPREPWALMTIASGYYPANWALRQYWNAHSAAVFEEAMQPWHPVNQERLWSTEAEPLQRETVLNGVQRFLHKAAAAGARRAVIYYVGHMVSSGSGDLMLLQGDVTPAHIRDVQTPSPPLLVPPESPLSGAGNLLDLHAITREAAHRAEVQGHAAVPGADIPNLTPGFLTLDSLYATAEQAGIPFALVVDGCLEDQTFQSTMDALGFQYDPQQPSQIFYVGQSPTVFREATQMAEILRTFRNLRPFLKGSNPVVLAAKPGTFAMGRENPFVHGGPMLGPLAVQARRLANAAQLGAEALPVATLVRQLADFRGLGEINLEGSISWSDFGSWARATPRPRAEAEATTVADAITGGDAKNAIVRFYEPGIGAIRDFVYAAESHRFILVDNADALWTWSDNGRPAVRVLDELPFASVGATASGEFYFHGGQTNELHSLAEGRPLIQGDLYLGFLAHGASGGSVIVVEDDAIVESPSPVWRLASGTLSKLGELETTGVLSAVEWTADDLFFTSDSSVIHRWKGGAITEFCRGLAQPQWLACDRSFLYCLSATSQTLHRITAEAKVSRASLASAELDRDANMRGFQIAGDGRLLIGAGARIAEFETARLEWH